MKVNLSKVQKVKFQIAGQFARTAAKYSCMAQDMRNAGKTAAAALFAAKYKYYDQRACEIGQMDLATFVNRYHATSAFQSAMAQ